MDNDDKPKNKYSSPSFDDDKFIDSYNKYDSCNIRHYAEPTEYMYISAEEKAKYLRSNEWKQKKQIRLILDDNKCAKCGNTNNLQLHHINYSRLTHEDIIDDLVILCSECHLELHEKLGYDRSTLYPID